MNIIINGETREIEKSSSITSLLKTLSLDGKVMAAAVNMEIIKQDVWSSYILSEGDKLELLDFVGGG